MRMKTAARMGGWIITRPKGWERFRMKTVRMSKISVAVIAAMAMSVGLYAQSFPSYLEMSGTTLRSHYTPNYDHPAALPNHDHPADLVIPNGVKIIAPNAFNGCDKLTSVTIPGSVMFIASDAFYDCKNLTSVTIQEGVRGIGYQAFRPCNSLTSITIPKSVTKIWSNAFAVTTVRYNGTKAEWKKINKDKDSFPAVTIVSCTDGEIMWWE